MKTFGVLALGWVVGGALLVTMSSGGRNVDGAAANTPARVEAHVVPTAPSPQPAATFQTRPDLRVDVLIPVAGIEPHQLRDTYEEARSGGRIHRAIDILAPRGTPVLASVDGTIRKLFTSRAGGVTIYQFDESESRVYYYAHLDRYANGLVEGASVRKGDVIGYVGTTGNAPRNTPHLHFSIEDLPPSREWWKGTPVNPYPILSRR